MTLRTRMTTFVCAFIPGIAFAIPDGQPRPQTLSFLGDNPGVTASLSADGIGAVFGAPLASNDNELITKDFVDKFLITDDNVGILGVDSVDLDYDSEFLISNGKFKVFTYTQKVAEESNLPMHGAAIKVVVLTGGTEKIVHLGAVLKHEPDAPLPADLETSTQALITVQQSADYGHLTDFSTPEKVVYNPNLDVYHRAWRFRGWDFEEGYLFFVDTNTGFIVGAIDIAIDADLQGRVQGYGTPGITADDPDNPASDAILMDLPGIMVTATGENPVYAATDGTYAYQTVFGNPVDVESHLEGLWVDVINQSYPTVPDLFETEQSVSIPSSGVDLLFNAPGGGRQPTGETAQVNAFVAIQNAHAWIHALHPNYTPLDRQVQASVNTVSGLTGYRGCNASYYLGSDPPRVAGFVPSTPGDFCNNSAYSTIMSHEYGHFILDSFAGHVAVPPSFHEGVADVVTAFIHDTPCLTKNFLRPDHPRYTAAEPCVRRLDAIAVNADYFGFTVADCGPGGCKVQLLDSRCGRISHCEGLALAQAFWDLRIAIADNDATDRIFADFLVLTRGRLDAGVIAEVLVADDDDGDFSTPSTHKDEIISAFTAHGWEDPTGTGTGTGVVVKWDGPVAPFEDPADGTDYDVHYEFFPPAVVLKTTVKGGDAVDRWRIGRDPASGFFDIGTITTDWTGTAQNIEVEVGTTTPCRLLYSVDIPRQSPAHYSSLNLVLDVALIGRARCVASSGNAGGLIQGEIDYLASFIIARGIGAGADPGNLVVHGELYRFLLDTIPAGSTLELGKLGDPGSFAGDLHGTLQVNDTLEVNLQFLGIGDSTGTLDIRTDLGSAWGGGRIEFAGSMSGDILVQGDINQDIVIAGPFTGNICANNLAPGDDLPQLVFDFGPGGTVCGWDTYCASDADCDDGCDCTDDVCSAGWCNYTVSGSGCEPCMPALARAPATASTNRYLAFAPSPVGSVAIQVELAVLGETAWVGAHDMDGVSELVSAPVYRTWSEPVIYVHGCRIVPSATYDVTTTTNQAFSGALQIQTIDAPVNKFWGDVVGTLISDPPQGITNVNDIQAIISGWQKAANAPHKSWLDLEPEFPNGVINFNDVFWVKRAFVGDPYPFSDPSDCDPAPPPPTDPGGIAFSTSPDDDLIDQGDSVVIDVFTGTALDVAVYEMSLEVTGGDTGSLEVSALVINQGRTDYIFTGETVIDSLDIVGGRLAATMSDGTGVTVTPANGYLGTFTLTASADASGVFEVKVRDIDRAFLSDSNVDVLGVNPGGSLFIGVNVECVNDGHCDDVNSCTDDTCVGNVCQFTDNCDDFNDCTTDSCNAGACEFVDATAGTSCEDGLFCTEPDTCDNKGACIGGPNDPCDVGEVCVEFMDTCVPGS